MARLLDSYRPAGNRYPLPNAGRLKQRRAERFERIQNYRPVGSSYALQNAARTRQRRAERREHTPPTGHRNVRRATAFSTRPYATPGRPSDGRTQVRRHSTTAETQTMQKPFRELSEDSATILKRQSGEGQRYERHGSSDTRKPRDGPTLEGGQRQRYWEKQGEDGAACDEETLPGDERNHLEEPWTLYTPQPEASTVPQQGVDGWRRRVAVAAMDADFCEGVYRGHSMASESSNDQDFGS